ncbi:PREDICTED: heavy metal-associated isoprenylated plant protein 6-like [Nicotiana attenuata]|uniref:Heavy metal-associated isoprenylated plant protein 3 n=1 Tax=Nicotiana attenuata TaxID=49451 RepID=A0A314KIG2_NICAT|nr:PREDICTED: heavy metal-associated isoprenylated plant protein 6-like [Nicotiana attenuata]OIT28584.1 heavy metal-associated isoprenylated plant protein 3 [Nicotiana attenuata]
MGEKKEETKAEGGEKKNDAGGDKKSGGEAAGGKKDDGPTAIILKLDLHCEGCAKKVKRSIRHFEGVNDVKADCGSGKLTVKGNVDPTWLREKVESKTKKKVELVSPQPKKDGGGSGGDKKSDEKKPEEKKAEEKNPEDKKPKEPQGSTVVLKIRLHCDGCAHKIKRIIKKIDGVEEVKVDSEKDLVTVKGTMDLKELIPYLKDKLKRNVEIVPPKKDDGGGEKKGKESGGDGGGGEEKKEKEGSGSGGGGEKKEGGSGEDKKEKKEGEPKAEGSKSVETKAEVNKMEYYGYNPQTHYAMPMYNQSYMNQDYGVTMYDHGYNAHTGYVMEYGHHPSSYVPPSPPPTYLNNAPQMFSDENPNGCSVM